MGEVDREVLLMAELVIKVGDEKGCNETDGICKSRRFQGDIIEKKAAIRYYGSNDSYCCAIPRETRCTTVERRNVNRNNESRHVRAIKQFSNPASINAMHV